jgi:hypothetical protein
MSRPPPRGRRVRMFDTRGLAFTPYSLSAKYSLLLPEVVLTDVTEDELQAASSAMAEMAATSGALRWRRGMNLM